MDNDKKWDRKEVVTVDPGSLLSGGVDVHLYGKGKDYGKHAHGWGRTKEEARENAFFSSFWFSVSFIRFVFLMIILPSYL